MSKRIILDPVTRIEGHAKISIYLDDNGNVEDAQFHVTEVRGFEKFCEGRMYTEMPGITQRICGICPVSHLLASARAGDDIMRIEVPEAARLLRYMMNSAQLIQSHALSFFHLSSPDFLLGFDSDPAKRNIFGVIENFPDIAKRGIRLRKFGQDIIEMLGGRKIHPAWAVPGGVREPFSEDKKQIILDWIPEVKETTLMGIEIIKRFMDENKDVVENFGNFKTYFMGLVNEDGSYNHHDGYLRIIDWEGNIVVEKADPRKYYDYVGEASSNHSYLKFPYLKSVGYPDGAYRVGPLARLNIVNRMGTPMADKELKEFKSLSPTGVLLSSFYYHYARLIEILHCIEKIEEIVQNPIIYKGKYRVYGGVNKEMGVGVSEAPRGTLFHQYWVDENGILKNVNLIIATGQNNIAMNRTVAQIAKAYIKGGEIKEGMLNRIEHGIRCYDPCLSCSTHAIGQMPMKVEIIDKNGNVVKTIVRD
ncbi:MAG: Ni/Fe hydrogenase subunit alpha [Brevinematia bacterium]